MTDKIPSKGRNAMDKDRKYVAVITYDKRGKPVWQVIDTQTVKVMADNIKTMEQASALAERLTNGRM